jgi:HTH-type transcriptional regulator / antitoxin HigA
MAAKTAKLRLPDTYFKLVNRFPLVHIRNDAHLRLASETINRLLQEDRDKGAEEYLDVLTDLVETYESQHVLIPDASEADVLRELMRANGLSQSGLAKEVKIAQSTISAVLTGARSLTKDQVLRLAKFFHASPAAFMPA